MDVGAGAGPYRELFNHCHYRTHDFGQEPSTIGRYTALDYVSDITAIPVDDQSFDVVLCTEVLEHVPEPGAAVREFARILCPGGSLLISAPLGSVLHQEPFHFYGGFTPHWYSKVLSEAGFESVTVESNMGFFSLFAQEARRFSALLRPRRSARSPLWVTLLWLVSIPVTRPLPHIAGHLDALDLERIATVGYHVFAVRSAS